jgi:hypothetical protein
MAARCARRTGCGDAGLRGGPDVEAAVAAGDGAEVHEHILATLGSNEGLVTM